MASKSLLDFFRMYSLLKNVCPYLEGHCIFWGEA
jgi:hypothetical protein